MKVFFTSILSILVTSGIWYLCVNNIQDSPQNRGKIILIFIGTLLWLVINGYEVVTAWFKD